MGVNGIYGLSGSGLDIESLVKMGMSNKNKQYDKMEQQEIANTWLKEAYNDVYNDLTVYKYDTLSTYKMQSNLNAMSATTSNSGVVTATANGAAAAMNHTVEVTSVASNAYLLTADGYGVTRANQDAKTSNKLVDVIFSSYKSFDPSEDGVGSYQINGSDTTVSGSDIAISLRLKDTRGSDTEYTLTYTYDELFQGEKTLNDFASAIARTGANIQGGYDTANDSFSFYNKTSGYNNVIGITADNSNTATLLNNLNVGVYDAEHNTLGEPERFSADSTLPTTMESTKAIGNTAKSVNFKDILGLSATVDGNTITVKDKDNQVLGTLTKNGDTIEGQNDTAFSFKISNGTSEETISFTYAELFDFSEVAQGRTSLQGKDGLDELASKINATGLGIEAAYDAVNDSFSLENPTGQATLTALGSGANQSVAQTMIDNLNLVNAPNLAYKVAGISGVVVTNGVSTQRTLGDILGITSTMQMRFNNGATEVNMNVKQDGTQQANIPYSAANTAKYYNGTYAKQTLFSFNISDGTNTATVDVTYGDVINFAAMENNDDYTMYYKNQSGTKSLLATAAGVVNVQAAQNDLSALAKKINDVAKDKHLNITAAYDSANGTFSILNPNGDVSLTDPSGSKFTFASKLSLADGEPSTVAYKVTKASEGIKRASTTSSDDSIAGALGYRAVMKDAEAGTLTIIKSDGSTDEKNVNDVAFRVKVGDSNNSKVVEFTYADLFDTTGSGNLKSKAGLTEFAKAVSDAENVNVKAAYNKGTGVFTLSNTGGYATLTGVDEMGASLVAKLGLEESETTAASRNHTYGGTDAAVTIDGKNYDLSTNKITVAGVTYNFLEKTNGANATISVSQDTEKIVDYVKSFVDDYNKLLDSLNEKLSEQKYSDYKPLSKRQEDEMTEKQIDKWNEKAKSGILYHNSEIQSLVSAMREAIYTKVDAVDSKYNTMSSIGITTTNTKGHLTLDTDKLKKALADDPDCVYQLFASDQDSSYIAGSTNKNKITTSQQKLDYANTGVANRLYNVMTNHMSKISDIAGTSKDTNDQSYLGKLITNMQTKMSSFKTMMTAYENKLYKRYDAMEVALARLNMQIGYISGSFS